jgi:hypothetical protein
MTEIGTKNYCQDFMSILSDEIVKESENLGPNPYIKKLVEFLSEWKR